MAFDDRLVYLLLGMAIGFVLGYFTRLVRETKEELDEVKDEIEKDVIPNLHRHERDEDGFISSTAASIMLLLVVGLAAFASFASQKASNDANHALDRVETISTCNQKVLTAALVALNERSTYTKASADANVDLQKSQRDFFTILLHQPPYSEAKQSQSVQDYYQDLLTFLKLAKKNAEKVGSNPYPDPSELQQCVSAASEK